MIQDGCVEKTRIEYVRNGQRVVGTVEVASEFVFVAGNFEGVGGLGRYGGITVGNEVVSERRRKLWPRDLWRVRRVDGL
jgi:hypothetical protein